MLSRNTTTPHEDGKRAIAISSDQSTAKGTQIYDGRSFGESQGTRASEDMWEGSRLYLGSFGQTRRLRRIYSERANSKMKKMKKKKKKKKNHSSDRSLSPTREYYDRVPTLETLSMEASRSKDGKRWVSGVRRTSKNESRGSGRKKLS